MKSRKATQAGFGFHILGRFGWLLVLMCLGAGLAQAQVAERQVLTVDLPGASILALNNRGDAAGYYCVQEQQSCTLYFNSRGFVRDANGTIETFDGAAAAINDAGTVAGLVRTPFVFSGFLRNKKGVVTTFDFGTPDVDSCGTYFMALNNREEVAGFLTGCMSAGIVHTFVAIRDKNGLVKSFQVPGDMIPTSINARGDLVAYFQGTELRGYLVTRSREVISLVPQPPTGPLVAYPVTINNSGDVAGYTGDTSGLPRGFLRDRDGAYTLFDGKPGAMNERGDIVGRNQDGSLFIRDASSGAISTLNCPTTTVATMNDRGDVAGGNVICSVR